MTIKTALLVLDMQNELIDPKGKVGSKGFASVVAERKLVEKIAAAIAEMRRQKMPIVFVRVGFEPGYVDVLSRSARVAHLKEMNALVIGEFGTEFPAELAPMPDELVVTKRAVSPFHNTNFSAGYIAMACSVWFYAVYTRIWWWIAQPALPTTPVFSSPSSKTAARRPIRTCIKWKSRRCFRFLAPSRRCRRFLTD